MMRAFALALLFCLAVVLAPARAEPAASAWVEGESGRLRLVSASLGAASSLRLGMQFQLGPEWKIYWRNPGDAGYPPRVDWAGSVNAEAPRILWPAPHRFELAGLQNHGYKGEVILPVDVTVPDPSKTVVLRAVVEFLACAQICVPQKAELALDLPPALANPSPFAHDIGRFAALVPGDGRRHGLTVGESVTWGEGDAARLALSVSGQEPFSRPDLFIEAEDVAAFGAPAITLSEGGRRALLEVAVVPGTVLKSLTGQPLRVTVTDGVRAVEAEVTPRAGTAPRPKGGEAGQGLAAMLLVALLGGLILNLMPCVLPVLSIKLLGIIGHGGGEKSHARAAFLASASGIIVSFLVLAGLALAVKAAGMAVGWGIQFQQPAFLLAMIALLVAFSANLLGFYEIRLPSALMNGGSGVPHHTLLGHFLSGAFATLLATPCSAPFLGTAIGFALARGPVEILAIFTALGLGMASPFLLVAVWPDAALRLPRPGPWMVRVRQAMGVALAGTALWLGTVLVALGGGEPAKGGLTWVPFDKAVLDRQVAEGRVVFVDVTADWCITCKVNKAAVVERGEVAKRLSAPGVAAMKADWTRPDESISRYLASFGRYGIPFNAVYGPKAPDGIALPELLTESEVLAALDRASAR